ncbi:MAG: nucleotidyltransferase family protein [Acidimicrobiales bacterium]
MDLLLARAHRILPLIHEGWVVAEVREWLSDAKQSIAVIQLALERELLRVIETLAECAIEARVLKGLATGLLDYPDPSMRQTGDVDVLVQPHDLLRSELALKSAGYMPLAGSNAIDPRLVSGFTLLSPSGVEVDIHAALSRYHPCTASVELFGSGERLPSGAIALSPEHRLIHAAGHLVWSPPGSRRASGLLDISRILDTRDLNMEQLAADAYAFGVAPLVGIALRVEAQLRGRPTPLIRFGRLPVLEHLAFLGAHQRVAVEHLLALSKIATWRQRRQYARIFLAPGTRVIRDRGGFFRYYGKLIFRNNSR